MRLPSPGPEAGKKAPWERGTDNAASLKVAFDDNRLASVLFGRYGENLALIERRLGVAIDQRGNQVSIEGTRDACEKARKTLEGLYAELRAGRDVATGDVEGALRAAQTQTSFFDNEPGGSDKSGFGDIRLRKRAVRARTAMQDAYIKAMKRNTLVFGIGPAGTGKTWLAVAHAVSLYERREVDRIVLSRPAVEAGERLGFLPGDMREKVDPYLRPMYDALYDLMDRALVERALQSGEIEIAPLAFMRGRTLANAAIILDEAQNTTPMQMKMFLTRLGEHSRMIVTGDPSQIDLPPGQSSGLVEATALLTGVEDIGQVQFTGADVVRHELVGRIVNAYDQADNDKKKGKN
jgi:phosphate starvation-inducible PhoH-like protein